MGWGNRIRGTLSAFMLALVFARVPWRHSQYASSFPFPF